MSSKYMLRCLDSTFGKVPILLVENMKYLSYDDTTNDFTCLPCDKIIKVVNNNEDSTTTNFKKHLYSNSHKKYTIYDDSVSKNLNATFEGEIPQIVQNNSHVLGMDGRNYKCEICDKTLKVSSNYSATENNFSYHLVSSCHEKKIEEYREALSRLNEIYGGIPRFVLNHMQFLDKHGKDYFCTICQKHIAVHPSDLNETEKSFDKHLHSLKHTRKAKEEKAFSVIPELRKIFTDLPNYMLRNIEYICINGSNFFCSLCNKNIKFNRHDLYETEQNFKLHITSETHEDFLDGRRDTKNEAFNLLHRHFETFPDVVLKNLKHIVMDGDDLYCNICKVTIYVDEEENDQARDNLVSHFESCNVDIELERQSQLITDLEDIFGNVPELIEENIQHMEFKGRNSFECLLCHKVMKSKDNGEDYEHNTSVTEDNFSSHLNSTKHREEVQLLSSVDDDLEIKLEDLFYSIPQFILNNLSHLGFEESTDNYYCYLCDKTILLVNGNKKEELTEQNFRSHLLSAGHMAKLKHKANVEMQATEELESIFCKVPDFIMCNIEHIENQGGYFLCTLCDAKILEGGSETTEQNFRKHLFGARHKSKVRDLEEENNTALQIMDFRFWRIPEFLLRNIDFLCDAGKDLFCMLCQENLPIDEDDLEYTKKTLRCHMDSQVHQANLKSM